MTYLNHLASVCVVSLYLTPLKKFTLFGVSELLKILKVSLIFIVLLSISSYRTWIISNIVLLNILPSGFKSEMAWIRPIDLFRTWIWSTWFAEINHFYEYQAVKIFNMMVHSSLDFDHRQNSFCKRGILREFRSFKKWSCARETRNSKIE